MELLFTKFFDRDYKDLPRAVQGRCDKQLIALLKDPHHPSLRTSKIQGLKDIWEGRISKGYRFTFQIIGDIYFLRRVGRHDDVLRRP